MPDEEKRAHGRLRKTLWSWAKRALGGLFIVGVLAMIVVAWMPKPVPVDVVTATRGAMRVTVDEDGRDAREGSLRRERPADGQRGADRERPGRHRRRGRGARADRSARAAADGRAEQGAGRGAGRCRAGRRAAGALDDGAHGHVGRLRAARGRATDAATLAQGSVSDVALERAELERRSTEEELVVRRVRRARRRLRAPRRPGGRAPAGERGPTRTSSSTSRRPSPARCCA